MALTEGYSNSGEIVDLTPDTTSKEYAEPSELEKELIDFIVDHTNRWRDHRDQNYADAWATYERVWRGIWSQDDSNRASERSKVISPATQQAIETRHAEIIEGIFGQGEYFDIADDIADKNGALDVEKLKNQLKEDFAQDKIRKSIDQIVLLGEIYGTGIGEIITGKEKQYKPMTVPMGGGQMAYGAGEKDRVSVKISPINPKNFLWDPNGTDEND